VETAPVELRDVSEVAELAGQVVARFEQDLAAVVGDVEVHHIGATAMPFGHTKGDVDVNIRVERRTFPKVVVALRKQHEVAQPDNWTATFASFSTDRYPLPLGVQVTVIGSADDVLLSLRDRMRSEPDLLRRYDERKVSAAPRGQSAYWEAKNDLLQEILGAPSSSS
jgi:GrpB-like predicted nucleotidyltransferase (UPF0157 family)